jgi:hypothetical protein
MPPMPLMDVIHNVHGSGLFEFGKNLQIDVMMTSNWKKFKNAFSRDAN